jgi:hypothetical protein
MRNDVWSSDDLFFLEAAFTSGMTLDATAEMLRKEAADVRAKARELGFIESPPTVPSETRPCTKSSR